MADIVELNGDIFQVDLKECGYVGRTAGYFVRGKDGWMLIETGPASSAGVILEAAGQLGIKNGHLKFIAVTHIHLDHAGGLGVMAKHFKEARLVVHPKGARHMIDPSRLIAGSLDFWGKEKMEQYGQVLPVDEERVLGANEGDVIDLGDRKIEIWETPGHARNHVCYYDALTNGVFSGDALGVYASGLTKLLGRPVIRIATPGPDCNAELLFKTLFRVAMSNIEQIYFTHFGMGRPPQLLIEIALGQLGIFMETGKIYNERSEGARNVQEDSALEMYATEMENYIRKGLLGQKNHLNGMDAVMEQEWEFQVEMVKYSAGGIMDYIRKSKKLSQGKKES